MIPIYRAKEKHNEKYIEGFYFNYIDAFGYRPMITSKDSGIEEEIDESTLAIHFTDMIDSEGTKIFASLSEDGRGGDCTNMENDYNETFMWDSLNCCIVLKSKHYEQRLFKNNNHNDNSIKELKIVGIQK